MNRKDIFLEISFVNIIFYFSRADVKNLHHPGKIDPCTAEQGLRIIDFPVGACYAFLLQDAKQIT